MVFRSLVLASFAALVACVSAHAATFGLEGSIGNSPTFSVTNGGVTATFSSPTGNGFIVQNTAGLLPFNTGLVDNNFFGIDPLTITFSMPVSGALIIPFGFEDLFSTTDSLTVTTNTNQTATFLGVPDGLAFSEPAGVANFLLAGQVSSVTLTGTSAFAVGDIATTPEPASIALLATGFAGIAGVIRRRRAS